MPSQVVEAVTSKATAVESLDEGEYSYQRAVGCIPDTLHERLADPSREVRAEVNTSPAWCLCEVPEGDYPRVRVFPDLENLVRHISRLEGEEVSIWAFYGTPLRITQNSPRGGGRYLCVSEQEVVIVPKGEDDSVRVWDSSGGGGALPAIQEDGWLGDASFTEENTQAYYAYENPKDDEFDIDDDDGDMAEVDA